MKSASTARVVSDRNNAPTKRSASEIVVDMALPESAEKVDRALVERSVEDIREIIAKTVSRGQDEVGRYLLKEFFDNDPSIYLASGPAKHASLAKLIDRC